MSDYYDQLADFDEKIVKHPQLASSYATNGFLSALVHLYKVSVSDNVALLKKVIRAFTIVLPPVFLTICKNETETQMWANTEELLQALRHSWIHHANTGVRIYAFKCLQLLVALESKRERKTEDPKDVFYLNLVRPGHRLLNLPELEKEGLSHLDVLLDRLSYNNENNTVITAIINCLTQLVKRRPQFTRAVIGALVAWCKSKPEHMAATDLKNVEKSIKLAFVAMIRTSRLSAYRTELTGAFTAIGGNPSALQSRSSRSNPDRHDETRRKRTTESSSSDRNDKKARTSSSQSAHAGHHHHQRQQQQQQFPIYSMNTGVDVTSLPLNVAANLCIAVLQNVSMDTLNDRFKMLPDSVFLQPNVKQHKLSSIKKSVSSSPVPVIKAEPSSTAISASELKLSNALANMHEARSQPLASTEERASQSFKMQPYNLADLQPAPEDQQLKLLAMSKQRLLAADYFTQGLQSSPTNASKRAVADTSSIPRLLTWDSTTKIFWTALISKIFTFNASLNDHDNQIQSISSEPEDNKPVPMDIDGIHDQEEMKKQLLSFILEDFPNRYDLALAWLHEERYRDMQSIRRQASSSRVGRQTSYYDWLLRLMDGSVSTSTNPKDKTLAKVLLAAPALNNDVIEKIHSMMQQQQTNRFVMCVATLRDLATQRPPVRTRCLSILLALCTDPDVKARSTAIAAVKRWIPLHPISKQIERHAIDTIHALLAEPPLPVINQEEEEKEATTTGPNDSTTTNGTAKEEEGVATKSEDGEPNEQLAPPVWEEQDVVRHLDLFFAVCTKKHDLLEDLFPVYTQASPHVQRYIRQHIYGLITSLGISSDTLVHSVKEYKPGSETLILRILKILCDTAPSTPALRALVKDIYVRKGLRAKFMVPIFTGQVTA